MNTKPASKWLCGITISNAALAILLIVVLYAIMLALTALAPEISGWPLYVILPLGVGLSGVGLRLTKSVTSHIWRYTSYCVNGSAFALHLFVILGLVALLISSTKERFLIPYGYRGDVYVVYGASDGEALDRTRWAVTYRIPMDGVLRVQGSMVRTWTRTEYYYQTKTGALKRIPNLWLTTIHATAENLGNDRDVGVFFPRTGRLTDATGCSVEYQLFYVGTKAHLLTKYTQFDIFSYLQAHPLECATHH